MGWVMGLVLLGVIAGPPASAHVTSYSYANLDWAPGRVAATVAIHRDDASALCGIPPAALLTPATLSRVQAPLASVFASRFHVAADGRPLAWRIERVSADASRHSVVFAFSAEAPHDLARLVVQARLLPDNAQHETFLNVYSGGRLLRQALLTAAEPSAELYGPGPAGFLAVLATFIRAGIHHIFIGPDHILFLLGLLLMGGGLGRVLRVATAFTAAHSITLALAATGALQVPSRIVEPLIALSVVAVGIENLRSRPGAPDRRAAMAFGFGLVHGLGFASVLREVGLTSGALGWSLAGFNVGVELGQAAIVLAVSPIVALGQRARPRATMRVVAFASLLIIAAGGWWFVQRLVTPS
jgi:hydrogenase/urease accessory protein HupE